MTKSKGIFQLSGNAIATRRSDGSFIHIMDPSVYQELDDHVEAKKTWTPEPVMIEVCQERECQVQSDVDE